MDGEMLLCDVGVFQKSDLPFVPAKEDVTFCVEELEAAQLLALNEKGQLQWSSFPKRPTNAKGKEKRKNTPLLTSQKSHNGWLVVNWRLLQWMAGFSCASHRVPWLSRQHHRFRSDESLDRTTRLMKASC